MCIKWEKVEKITVAPVVPIWNYVCSSKTNQVHSRLTV